MVLGNWEIVEMLLDAKADVSAMMTWDSQDRMVRMCDKCACVCVNFSSMYIFYEGTYNYRLYNRQR